MVVGIFGIIYNLELREIYYCLFVLYEFFIIEFKLDIICGEVYLLSWQKYIEDCNNKGYWGELVSEYWEFIFLLCEENQIEFVFIDWFELDVWNYFDLFGGYFEVECKELEKKDDEWFLK